MILEHIRKVSILSAYKNRQKKNNLNGLDLAVLTLIFWASSILTSTQAYIDLCRGAADVMENSVFSAADNYAALAFQAGLFLLALLYLKLRNFNFKRWKIQFSFKAVGQGLLIFAGAALLQDLYTLMTAAFSQQLPFPGPLSAFFGDETVSTVIYAIFNGVYEEIYFLGICLAVPPGYLKWVLPFSLLIRMSFHTYQGMLPAFGIGLIFGSYMLYSYKKSASKNLLPFFLAHALGDIFGLGILWFFGY